jgi:structural maintenance of chromosome 2
MHIIEIVLDGFKSYATRTVISGFDPQFNAITGLNGSGKSNVLDSICFVLGISNLSQVPSWRRSGARLRRACAGVQRVDARRSGSRCRRRRAVVRAGLCRAADPDPCTRLVQVRASNLNELIYKQGQAGVTKASVTLVFDNSDRELSPHGYDHYKKITVTRQARLPVVWPLLAATHRPWAPPGSDTATATARAGTAALAAPRCPSRYEPGLLLMPPSIHTRWPSAAETST